MVTGQHAPQRGMFLSVACSSAWHVPQRGMLPSVACSPMWYLPLPSIVELQRVFVYAAKM